MSQELVQPLYRKLKFSVELKPGRSFDKQWLDKFIMGQNKKNEYNETITRTEYDSIGYSSLSFTFNEYDIVNAVSIAFDKANIDIISFTNDFENYCKNKENINYVIEMFSKAVIMITTGAMYFPSGFFLNEFIVFLEDALSVMINNKSDIMKVSLTPLEF